MRRVIMASLVVWGPGLGGCDEGGEAPPGDDVGAAAAAYTYHRDVVPIMQAHCTGCHVAGGVGPFRLDDYAEVVRYAPLALGAMRTGQMPPWMPDRTCRTFEHERGVDAAAIDVFAAWLDEGAPEGDPADAPASVAASPWAPSDVLPIAQGYLPDAGVDDDYHCFVLERTFDHDVYLTASQVVAGSSQVHHVLVYAMGPERRAAIAAADAAADGPGYPCFGGPIETAGASEDVGGFLAGGPLPDLTLPTQIGGWVPAPCRSPCPRAPRCACAPARPWSPRSTTTSPKARRSRTPRASSSC